MVTKDPEPIGSDRTAPTEDLSSFAENAPADRPSMQEALFRTRTTKKAALADSLSCFVENAGVEPATSCMPCKRSSQLS